MLCLNASEVELLQLMEKRGVRFLVIGGHAVQFHGHIRPAKDLDIFYSVERDNPSRLLSALLATQMVPPAGLSTEALSSPRAQV